VVVDKYVITSIVALPIYTLAVFSTGVYLSDRLFTVDQPLPGLMPSSSPQDARIRAAMTGQLATCPGNNTMDRLFIEQLQKQNMVLQSQIRALLRDRWQRSLW
jgi:hypothetical protein